MHRATATPVSPLCINVTRHRRNVSMVTVSESRVEQASFTPLVFATTGGMGREAIVFYRRWLTIYLAAALLVTVRLWLLSDAHCLFLYFGQLQCAYVEVGPSRIAPLMPLLRWAALMSTGTFKLLAIWSFLFSCPARAFFVLGVVGKGSPSSPAGKKNKKTLQHNAYFAALFVPSAKTIHGHLH